MTATQKYEELNAEVQKYFDLATVQGRYVEFDDFREDWAQLGWYSRWEFEEKATNFYLTAHFKWSSAYRQADISGCGFAFAIQDNGDHYAMFLDKSKVLFVKTDKYYYPIGPVHGTGRVSFGNPFDKPNEADVTLVVKGTQAYVLVDGETVGEYALAKSSNLHGVLGYTLLSGTNKGYGTRCEITNTHGWIEK
ncbi:MAG: hypothetical protein IPP66_22720 [Anaerolineales bacterium]|nr:hypothetical protein [Anaerolineales bacterium]